MEHVLALVALADGMLGSVDLIKEHPHKKIIQYEDFCLAPYKEFEGLYEFCGLEWNPNTLGDFFHPDVEDTGFRDVHKVSAKRAYAWLEELSEDEVQIGLDFIKKNGLVYRTEF
jgi:hypothetical protein